LWEYLGEEYTDTVAAAADRIVGFDRILNLEALERIGILEPLDRIVGSREGVALVRDDEVVGAIESPP
jgi:hypothetical protein